MTAPSSVARSGTGKARADAVADRTAVEQMRVLQGSAATAAFINPANACVLGTLFWGELPTQAVIGWWAFNVIYTLVLFADRNPEEAAFSPWPLRRVALRATALGLVWGYFVWEMTKIADADSMLVVGVVMVGMMAGGAVRLAIVPSAATASSGRWR